MQLSTLILFIPACFALNMSPGPNNLLAMNNAHNWGFRAACLAGIGRIVAFFIMIVLAASGLAIILYTSETLFFLVKFIGALYLFWLAFKLWTSKSNPLSDIKNTPRNIEQLQLAKQEFILAAGNPKAILIFTAFIPQFINTSNNSGLQFVVFGAMFLVLEYLAIVIYAYFGLYLRHWFSSLKMLRRFNRICATVLGIIGVNLLFSRQSTV